MVSAPEPATELFETPHGPARVHRLVAGGAARAALMLGHGAGGSVEAPDLQAVSRAAVAAGITVFLVEQPYRVAGRKSAAPAPQLDVAWISVARQLGLGAGATAEGHGGAPALPLIVGGRSSGARVACRTAAELGAAGALALAFPLITPKGVSRQDELDGAGVPVLVVQGRNDRFGLPRGSKAAAREVVRVEGDHGLKRELPRTAAAAIAWIDGLLS